MSISHDCLCLRAARTRCHALGALNGRNVSSPRSGGWRSEVRVCAGLRPSSPPPAPGRGRQTWHYWGNTSQGAGLLPGSRQQQEEGPGSPEDGGEVRSTSLSLS